MFLSRLHGLIREHIIKPLTRSGRWRTVRKDFLEAHPTCAACGGTKWLNVHHKMPFHDEPEKELDPNNLITLCMGKNECHLKIGHGNNFKCFNDKVTEMAKEDLEHPEKRGLLEEQAKENKKC
jgi:hypothetical protein